MHHNYKRIYCTLLERLFSCRIKKMYHPHLLLGVADMESEWATFCAAITEAAVKSCGCTVTGANSGSNPRTWWCTPEVKGAIKLKKPYIGWPSDAQFSQPPRQKLKYGRSSVKPWKKTFGWAKSVRQLRRGKQHFVHIVYGGDRVLLTSTKDIIGQWMELLNPTHKYSGHE